MILWLRYVLGVLIVILIAVDHWATIATAGIFGGLFVTLVWMGGSVLKISEYWQESCPLWMIRLFGRPSDQRTSKFTARQNYILTRIMFLIFSVAGIMIFVVASISGHYNIILAVFFLGTLMIGVALSEFYLRSNYTKIKNWAELDTIV